MGGDLVADLRTSCSLDLCQPVATMLSLTGAALAFRPPVAMLELNRAAASVAMPVVAAGLIAAASAMPAHAAVKPSTGEQVFQGNCAACHAGGRNVIRPEKTLNQVRALHGRG